MDARTRPPIQRDFSSDIRETEDAAVDLLGIVARTSVPSVCSPSPGRALRTNPLRNEDARAGWIDIPRCIGLLSRSLFYSVRGSPSARKFARPSAPSSLSLGCKAPHLRSRAKMLFPLFYRSSLLGRGELIA
jgi:hypothetical protein